MGPRVPLDKKALGRLLGNHRRSEPRPDRHRLGKTKAWVVIDWEQFTLANQFFISENVEHDQILPRRAEERLLVQRPRRAVAVLAPARAFRLGEWRVRRHAADLAHLIVVRDAKVQQANGSKRFAVVRGGSEHVFV